MGKFRKWTVEDIPLRIERSGTLSLTDQLTDAFREKLRAEGRAWLPELVVFTGDYVATGALVAMREAGIRIPRDAKVVSLANKGLGPVSPVPLTRIEFDPETHGDLLADAVCAFIQSPVTARTGIFAIIIPHPPLNDQTTKRP